MIRQRFILAALCSVSIGFVADCGLASELKTVRRDFEEEKLTIVFNNTLANREVGNRERFNSVRHDNVNVLGDRTAILLSQSKLEGETESSANADEDEVEPPRAIDRRFALAAMAVTLIIASCLTINLFRRPKRKITSEITVLKESKHLEESRSDGEQIVSSSPSSIQAREVTELVADSDLKKDRTSEAANPSRDKTPSQAKLSPAYPHLADIDVVAELIDDLQRGDRQLRRKAIWELAERGDARSLKPLMEIVPHLSPLDKSLINKAVTQIIARSLKPINDRLFAKLQDRNPQVRKNAVCDLRDLYLFVAPITKKLVQMQQDADPDVSQTAARALSQLNCDFAAKKLDNSHVNYPDRLENVEEDKTSWQLAALLADLDNER